MTKWLLVFGLMAGAVAAWALTPPFMDVTVVDATDLAAGFVTGAVPPKEACLGSTTGMSMSGVKYWRARVCAQSTDGGSQGLNAQGTIQVWVCDPADAGIMIANQWSRNKTLDWTITSTTECQTQPDFAVGPPLNGYRLALVPSAVYIDGGQLHITVGTCLSASIQAGGCL